MERPFRSRLLVSLCAVGLLGALLWLASGGLAAFPGDRPGPGAGASVTGRGGFREAGAAAAGAGGGGGGAGGAGGDAQGEPGSVARYEGPRHSLSLRVEDPSGHGLAGAEVLAFPELLDEETSELHGTTDRAGSLVFDGLPPGGVELAVTLPGFATGRLLAKLPAALPAVVVLAPQALLHVRVRGDRGEPLAGAALRLTDGRLELDEEAHADAAGEASFAGLPAGEATLRVEAPGHLATSLVVALQSGERLQLAVRLGAAEQVEGRVLEPGGAPAAGTTVAAFALGGLPRPQDRVTTDEQGNFLLDRLPRGSYTLVATPPDGPSAQASCAAPARGVTIRLPAGASVRARLLLADGGEAQGVVVDGIEQQGGGLLVEGLAPGSHRLTVTGPGFAPLSLEVAGLGAGEERDLGEMRLSRGLTLTGQVLGPDGTRREALVAVRPLGGALGAGEGPTLPDGSFEIPDLPAGRYRVTARARGLAPATQELALAPPGAKLTLRLEAGAFVRGTVLSAPGVPAPRRTELLATVPGLPGEVARAFTDAAGAFVLGPLPPGDYLLVLQLGRRLSTSRVTLGSSDLELTLGPPEPGARIFGTITVAGGPPLTGAGVALVPGRVPAPTDAAGVVEVMESPGALLCEADARDGSYRLDDVPPGERTLVVLFDGRSADEGRAFALPVEVPASGALELDVAVPQGLVPFDLSPLR